MPPENGTDSISWNFGKELPNSLRNNPEKGSFYPYDCDGDGHMSVISGVMNIFYRRTFVCSILWFELPISRSGTESN
jgi:hypothetical protein